MNSDSSEAAPHLQAESVSREFKLGPSTIGVLSDLSGAFPSGEATMIQGASGSGKSTLLHILGGLDRPEAGRVLWKGESIYDWNRARLADWRNQTVGFVFQSYQLMPELSAWENVDMPAMLARRGSKRRAEELLDLVGLAHRCEHRPRELSGGEQQRVAIARALRNDPPLLLADEPTGNLDAATGGEIIDLLLALQSQKQKTLIVVTHDDAIAARGRRCLHLRNGQLGQ